MVKLFKTLRNEMYAHDLTNIILAKKLNRTSIHVSHCLNNKAQFMLSEQYTIMELIDRPYQDLYLIFPKGGRDITIVKINSCTDRSNSFENAI